MPLSFEIIPYTLHFKQPAGTSRGVYRTRQSWYVLLWNSEQPLRIGIGECAPLPDLSCDAFPDYEKILTNICRKLSITGNIDVEALRPYPSMLFGLETALRHLQTLNLPSEGVAITHHGFAIWNTPFSHGEKGIPINGLIWMGRKEEMLTQIEQKMAKGFRCIKLKIGAIDFEEEISLIRHIRTHFSPEQIEIRVDANGAFSPEDALQKLERLAAFGLHSIEQPIRAGQWEAMAKLVTETPLPIALDEELIGCNDPGEKRRLLEKIHPRYIILKPSLHGGIHGCMEWIAEAERLSIGWWITSALESNIGLNAIAQWCATLNASMPQGLGTGALFTDNIDMPLVVERDQLWFKTSVSAASTPFCSNRNEQTLTLCGIPYTKEMALALASHRLSSPNIPEWERNLFTFVQDWWNDSSTLEVHTSGSTGTPKRMRVEKQRMMQSAILTCSALQLHRGDKALLCLPVRYIAGKMMVVRALVAGLNLYPVAPDGHPLAAIPPELQFDFAAMIPLQVYNSFQEPQEKERFKSIRHCIIGGAAIDQALKADIRDLPNACYSTYGMTETLSHIALQHLNGPKASSLYYPFSSVKLSLSEENTLVIDAPMVAEAKFATNDIARIHPDGGFEILGRKDNVINSGGIKLQIETLEQKLSTALDIPFMVTSVPDPKLGEKVILLVQSQGIAQKDILTKASQVLTAYEQPKQIFFVASLPLTPNGKPDRKAAKELAKNQISSI